MSRYARHNPEEFTAPPEVRHAHIDCDALAEDHRREYLQEVAYLAGRDLTEAEKESVLDGFDDTANAEREAEKLAAT